MEVVRQSEPNLTYSSRRWAMGLMLLALTLQIVVALFLNAMLQGKEIGSDVGEYRQYVANPTILLNPPPGTKMIGGWVASPLLPFMLTVIYQPLVLLGANEFLAFRGTMIFWNTLGFGLSVGEIFRRWGYPQTKRDVWLALGLTFSPLTWLPSAVLTQDETVAAFWCAVCFVCWSRAGVWGCWIAAAIGVFVAKPFLLVYGAALWMVYPAQRKALVAATSAVLILLLGFMYWRDGDIAFLTNSVSTAMNGSLYSAAWLLDGIVTFDRASQHRGLASKIAKFPTMLAMAGYALLALRVRFTLPSALVGLYCVMFSFLVGMMPEYELWFWSWSMLLIWVACRQGEWLLGSLLYLHSLLGYAYKILYSCDPKNFYLAELKPTAIWYNKYVGYDLWWVMLLLSIVLFLNTLVLAILLWRKYPRFVEENLPHAACDIAPS